MREFIRMEIIQDGKKASMDIWQREVDGGWRRVVV